MSFTRHQQPQFRQLVRTAWAAHSVAAGLDPADKAAQRAWYEAEMITATGKPSSTDCNAGRDYDLAMAHFEALAGAGIGWNLRLFSGDARRILHEIRKVATYHEIDEDYLRGVARRMLGRDDLPELHTLPREVLVTILGEVKRYVRDRLKAEQPF